MSHPTFTSISKYSMNDRPSGTILKLVGTRIFKAIKKLWKIPTISTCSEGPEPDNMVKLKMVVFSYLKGHGYLVTELSRHTRPRGKTEVVGCDPKLYCQS